MEMRMLRIGESIAFAEKLLPVLKEFGAPAEVFGACIFLAAETWRAAGISQEEFIEFCGGLAKLIYETPALTEKESPDEIRNLS